MRITELLQIERGLTALIGGGGKTSLMYRLAEELRGQGRVVVCTSTKIRRPTHLKVTETDAPDVLAALLEESGAVCIGTTGAEGKFSAPRIGFETLTALADYVIVEADGSKRLPMKAHLPHEPVIPPNAGQTILVVGADGFGRPIREACHRPERFAALAGAGEDAPVTPGLLAKVIRQEGFGDRVFVNKAENEAALGFARTLAGLLPCPVVAGSLWKEDYQCLS